jgi:hypothetical protein
MIRQQFAGDERPTPGLPEDPGAEGWWAGTMMSMSGLAAATAVAASTLTAQIGQQLANSPQDDPQLAAPPTLQVEDDAGAPLTLARPEWDTVVSLWWDDSGPIEHVPTQEIDPVPFPAPNLWFTPLLLLWPTEEAVTPPPPLPVDNDEWWNPLRTTSWIRPPIGLVPQFQEDWPTPVFPLPPDEDFWSIPRPQVAPSVYQQILLWPTDEKILIAVPLGIDEGEWQNLVAPQLWSTPPAGLVPGFQDEWPTPLPLGIDEGEWRSNVAPSLWVLPPVRLVSIIGDEWPTPATPPTLHGLHVVNRSHSYLRILNHSRAAFRIIPRLRQGGRPMFGVLNPYADLEVEFEVTNKAASDGHWEDTLGLSPTAFLSLTPTGSAIGGATVALAVRSGDPNTYYGVIDTSVLQSALLPTYAYRRVYLIFLVSGDDRRKHGLLVGGVGDFDS